MKNIMTEQEILMAMESSYNEEMIAMTYESQEDDYQVTNNLGNCSFKENSIYFED